MSMNILITDHLNQVQQMLYKIITPMCSNAYKKMMQEQKTEKKTEC